MIVTGRKDSLLLFTQPDHAGFAARLFSLWRRDGLPQHPRRNELLFAIREHDNGWREEDAAPRLDPDTSLAISFDRLPSVARLEVWRRGVHRFADDHAYASQLIARHAEVLHTDHWDQPGWLEFGDELVELEDKLRGKTELPLSAIEEDYGFLRLADTLSLGACGALGLESSSGEGYRYELELGRIGLDPFPLAGATTLALPYRSLANRPSRNAAGLGTELAAAEWRSLDVRVEPLDS